MKNGKRLKILVMVAMAMTLTMAAVAQAGQFKVLHEFRGSFEGLSPNGDFVQDGDGNLFGTTFGGGILNGSICVNGCGTVFELSPNGTGGWTLKTLYRFKGKTDGGEPIGALVMDASGNLFGTAQQGGSASCPLPGCGTIFELSPTGSGGWTEQTIFTFNNTDGAGPVGLIPDGAGNFYGVASAGGARGRGLVYELSPGTGGTWSETVLVDFSNTVISSPVSRLLLDSGGNLLGTTLGGGTLTGNCKNVGGCGAVFELSPISGGGWSFTDFAFPGRGKGLEPRGNLLEDASGNVFSTTFTGGVNAYGNVFKLSPASGGGWTESVIHIFDSTKGAQPEGLADDGNGGFYGVAFGGGNASCNDGCGMIFDLTPGSVGGWVETILHRFSGGYDGGNPNDNLMVDGNGNIFGAAAGGGVATCPGGCGTVFEITAPASVRK